MKIIYNGKKIFLFFLILLVCASCTQNTVMDESPTESDEMVTETLESIKFKVPKRWDKRTNGEYTYYYINPTDYMMTLISDDVKTLNDTSVQGFLEGFKQSEGVEIFEVISGPQQITINELPCYSMKIFSNINSQDNTQEIYLINYDNITYCFYMVCMGNEFKFTEQMQEVMKTVEVISDVRDDKSGLSYEIIDQTITLWKDSIGSVHGNIVVEIQNTGTETLFLLANDFDIEDGSGKLVSIAKSVDVYPNIIHPGEVAVYYKSTSIDEISDPEMTVNLVPHIKAEKSKLQQILLPVEEISITDTNLGIKAIGRITNNTEEEISICNVAIVCRDENSKVIAVLYDWLNDVAAGDRIGFETNSLSSPDNITASSIHSYEAYAYPWQIQY